MGFLKNLKAGIEAAQAAGNAMAGTEAIPEFVWVNPVPQDEVDRLLAGTGTIRAIVYRKTHQILQNGERVGRMTVKLRVRPRGPAGSLGDEVELKASISSITASLIEKGLDVPIERDPATGAPTRIASAQLTDELASRRDEAEKRNPRWGLDPDVEGMIEVGKAIRTAVAGAPAEATVPPPESVNDPRRSPVEGTTWEAYVAIMAHIAVKGAPNSEDFVAREYGVRPYTWAAISNVWRGRIATDPELGRLYDTDLASAIDRIR